MSFLINRPYSISSADITSADKSVRDAHLVWQKKDFEAYTAYLAVIKNRLPPSVYEFAIADWHYDATDPRCPHDAWIQSIEIKEIAEGERHEIRKKQIEIILLGAYHDRLLKLTYFDVMSYSMSSPENQCCHGDWLVDELSLSPSGLVIHEIEFRSKAKLKIECKDILFEEKLTSSPYTAVWS